MIENNTPKNDTDGVSEERIEELLLSYSPKPSNRFYNEIEPSFPWIKTRKRTTWLASVIRNRLFPVGTALIAITVVLIWLFNSTTVQVTAQKLIQFFAPGLSEKIQIDFPVDKIILPPNNDLSSLEEIKEQSGVGIILPGFIPERFEFSGAKYINDLKMTLLYYQDNGTGEYIQISLRENPNDTQSIGPGTEVEIIMVGESVGEYIHGAWQAPEIQDILQDGTIRGDTRISAAWDPDAEVHILRWNIDPFLAEIIYRGNFNDPSRSLDKSVIIAIAQSMKQE